MDGWILGSCVDGWIYECMDRRTDVWMDGGMDGWVCSCVDAWID